ncbi:hypothetical protein AB4Z46_31815 [Variovorax sp. M-6]
MRNGNTAARSGRRDALAGPRFKAWSKPCDNLVKWLLFGGLFYLLLP